MIKDLHFQFIGFSGTEGRCHLRIAQKTSKSKMIIICSQYKNYYGTSTTNAIEIIAEKFFYDVVNGNIKGISFQNIFEYEEWHRDISWIDRVLVKLNPQKYNSRFKNRYLNIPKHFNEVIWIERYPAGTGLRDYEDDYYLVSMGDQKDPHWHERPSEEFIKNETGFELSELLADAKTLDLIEIRKNIKNLDEQKSLNSSTPNRQVRWTQDLLKQLPTKIKNMKFILGMDDNSSLNEVNIHSLIKEIFSVSFPIPELFESEFKVSKLLNIYSEGSEKKCDLVIYEPESTTPVIMIEVKRVNPLLKNQAIKINQDIAKLLIYSKKIRCDSYLLIYGNKDDLKRESQFLDEIFSFKNNYKNANYLDKISSTEALKLTSEYKNLLEKSRIYSVNTRLIGISDDNTIFIWQISHTPSNLVSNKPYQFRIFKPSI